MMTDQKNSLVCRVDFEGSRKKVTVGCSEDGGKEVGSTVINLSNRSRAFSGRNKQRVADVIASNRPTMLDMIQVHVDVRQFCEHIVPQMAASVKMLRFRLCNDIDAADIKLLSASLTANAGRLELLMISVQSDSGCEKDNNGVRDAIAALCSAQPTIACLIVDGLDDSWAHAITYQPYALITELMRSSHPTQLCCISLPNTPIPTRTNLSCMEPVDPVKMETIKFLLEGGRAITNLNTHHATLHQFPRRPAEYELFPKIY
jgi:hypothetical protein